MDSRNGFLLATALLCLIHLPAAQGQEEILPFYCKRAKILHTQVDRKVLAFYYTWYGRPENHGLWVHWDGVDPSRQRIATSTHYPVKGAYDSQDPALIDDHIAQAKACGIDGFICTWWGKKHFDDVALKRVLHGAKGKDFEISIYWETIPGHGEAQIQRGVSDLSYLLENYGHHEAFLKMDGKPVLFVYGRVMNQISPLQWKEIITRTEARYGNGFLLIADGYSRGNARLFDGIHTYNICAWVATCPEQELSERSGSSFRSAVDLARRAQKISCLTVIPGYNDTKIRDPGIHAPRREGRTYQTLWKEAVEADPDWILITSWNEWHEGSEIEPSVEHGDTYLKLTKTYALSFKELPERPVPETHQEEAEDLKALFQGKIVALLPDFTSEAVFFLADAGIALKELTWEEVTDPKRFNPAIYPITVYGGFEGYQQTVNRAGDVDQGILNYLKEGGLLMALGAGPFPFYYNEKGETVNRAKRFGFPILGSGGKAKDGAEGWEVPPEGRTFFFEIDSDLLPGMEKELSFPLTGDQRWRPAAAWGLEEGDLYLPMARLRSRDHAWWGDGIVYIEHKRSKPRGGRNLYAWMGLTQGEHGREFLHRLFMWAGKKRFQNN